MRAVRKIAFALNLLMPPLIGVAVRAQEASNPAARRDAPTTAAAAEAPAALDEVLEEVRKKHGVPALAAAVVREGQTIALGATGVREAGSGHRVSIDDRFHIGSCTKSMTATLCAMLVERGTLRWDSKVGEVLPDLKDSINPSFREVTLEQLLCHRSGLPDDHAPDLVVYPKLLALDGEIMAQRRKMVQIVMDRPPAHEVGTKFAYSNNGFAIAGAMCEAAAKESYESLLRRMLFKPLDMKTAGFGAPGSAKTVDQPRGHTSLLGWYLAATPGPTADNPPVYAPAGTVHCSIGDWAKYAALHLDAARGKPRLLKAETFARLHGDPYKQEYGFGWAVIKADWSEGKVLAHDGTNRRWYAAIVIAPDEDLALLTATNAGSDAAAKACVDARKAIRAPFLK